MAWTDSHCHLPYEGLPGVEQVIEAARAAGVTRLITVGTDLEHSRQVIEVAAAHHGVWATAGLHPHEARRGLDGVEPLLDDPAVVAVGECGLDYHYDHSPRAAQRDAFAAQVGWARARDLALVVHTREAWDDTFAILRSEGPPARLVFHCFTGGTDEARRALDLGGYLSFSGIVTFPSADDVRDAAALCPLDRLLVETDSPYLAPAPGRRFPNEPARVVAVGAALATLRGLPIEDVEAVTWANAEIAFGLWS